MNEAEFADYVVTLETRVKALEAGAQKKLDDTTIATTRMAYTEYGSQIRHYSTIRSALTTFLVTAGMTSFAGYQDKKISFLFFAGLVFASAAILVCGWFSYKTERVVMRYKSEWNILRGVTTATSHGPLQKKIIANLKQSIAGRMVIDLMNWLLILAAGSFLWIALQDFPQPGPAADNCSWSE